MQLTINIQGVQTLIVSGGGDCFSPPAPSARERVQAAPAPASPAYVTPPMQMLRAAIHRKCPTCGGSKQITRNVPDFAGDFETAPCPTCRERRPQ